MNKGIKKIVFCAMYIALGVAIANVLHWASGGIGRILSPMHFTVLICGMMLGWQYGIICGILTPLISAISKSLIFSLNNALLFNQNT